MGYKTKIGFTIYPDRDVEILREERERKRNELVMQLKDNLDPL